MRKLRYVWLASVVVAMAASCTLNPLEEPSASGSMGTQVTLTAFAADSDAGSKAMLVDGAPDIFWSPGEEIMVFNRSWGTTMFRATNTEPAQVVGFSGSVSGYAGAVGPENQVWAAYPASWDHVWFDNKGGYVEMVLPHTQAPVAGSFDPTALLMTARAADTNLAFYHVGGGLKFKLTQDWVQQVELRANDKTPLAGYVQVVMDEQGHPVVSEYYETVNAVQMTAPRGERLQPGVWYYLCCLPGVLEQGYTLTFRSEDKTGVSVHAGPGEVKRATWGVLEAADAGVVPEDAENDLYGNAIYYTTTDGKIVEPNCNYWRWDASSGMSVRDYKSAYGADIISNTYEDGKGVILFDGPVTSIPSQAFEYSTLTSVQLPSTVLTIDSYAFNMCENLVSVHLGDWVAKIDARVFQSCSLLAEINIPGSVQNVGEGAFFGCSSLGSFNSPLVTADGRGLVVDGAMVAFAPGGLSYPVDYVVEDGITHLGDRVFAYNYLLDEVTLPESLVSFGEQVFTSSSNLSAFHGKFASEDGHLLVKDGEIIAAALSGVTEFVIPGAVRSIAPYAFSNMDSLLKLTLEEGVETVGDFAFSFCDSLQEITLPESLTSLGQQVFRSDHNIRQFRGKFASANGQFLVVDGTLMAVAASEQVHCTVPDGVTKIGDYLFYSSGLQTITLPEGVTEIGASAFSYCGNLTGVNLPSTLRIIGTHAFWGCQNEGFTEFTIPAGVTTVGYEIISYCDYLRKITVLPATPPAFADDYWCPLGNGLDKSTIYVPAASLEAYTTTWGWNHQSNYQAIQ